MPKLKQKRKIDIEPEKPREEGEPEPPPEWAHPVEWAAYKDKKEAWETAKKEVVEIDPKEGTQKALEIVREGRPFRVLAARNGDMLIESAEPEEPQLGEPDCEETEKSDIPNNSGLIIKETAESGMYSVECPNCIKKVDLERNTLPKKYKKCYLATDEKDQVALAFIPETLTTKQLGRIAQIIMEAGLSLERGTTLEASALFESQVIEDDPQKDLPFPKDNP